MTTVREMAVAGQFYPNDPQKLKDWLTNWLNKSAPRHFNDAIPRALIVPHAGYIYSGITAAAGYRLWQTAAEQIITVVIVGPAHRVAFEGMTTLSVDAMETPLGPLALDVELRDELLSRFNTVQVSDFAQQQEHSIEVQLPFIKQLLPDVKVLPLLNGQVSAEKVSEVLQALWQKEGVYFVISSDLSHFATYENAQLTDRQTAKMIKQCDWQNLNGERACGYKGIQGLLALQDVNPKQIQPLELINSGDTAGDKSRVVGYGTWAIYDAASVAQTDLDDTSFTVDPTEHYPEEIQDRLLQIAKRSIEFGLHTGQALELTSQLHKLPESIQLPRGCFVTLEKNGQLRGCIGSLQAVRPLAEDVATNAFNAAFRDPRFPALSPHEVKELTVSISVLTTPEVIENCETKEALLEQLVPNMDGLIISDGARRATFLPSVWEQLPDKVQFINHLMKKADMPFWSAEIKCERYHSIYFSQSHSEIKA